MNAYELHSPEPVPLRTNFLSMTKQRLRGHADQTTPATVSIPNSWAGLLMWAIGQHGPIVLFVFSTWFLYNDNKANQAQIYKDNRETQAQMMDVAKAQIAVNAQVVTQLTDLKTAIGQLADEAKRAHRANP